MGQHGGIQNSSHHVVGASAWMKEREQNIDYVTLDENWLFCLEIILFAVPHVLCNNTQPSGGKEGCNEETPSYVFRSIGRQVVGIPINWNSRVVQRMG